MIKVKEVEFKIIVSVYEDEELEDIKKDIERGIDKMGLGVIDIEIGEIVNEYEFEC